MSYVILNGTTLEEGVIREIISHVNKLYSDKVDVRKLKFIEIVDSLENNSSGRTVRDKIFLPRIHDLETLECTEDIWNEESVNIKRLISTIYHELWHVTTWNKYKDMYEYVLDENNDDITALAFNYWIEYVAHMETVFMEETDTMKDFCQEFVKIKWHRMEYGYQRFIKAASYFIVRSRYLENFDELVSTIQFDKLRKVIIELDEISKSLYNKNMKEHEKAMIVKEIINGLYKK